MKRFIGMLLAIAGGVATLWGGYSVLTGTSQTRLTITHDFEPTAMVVGLVGVAALTVGLVWVRD